MDRKEWKEKIQRQITQSKLSDAKRNLREAEYPLENEEIQDDLFKDIMKLIFNKIEALEKYNMSKLERLEIKELKEEKNDK